MDWPSPNSGLSDDDLSRVFLYLPQEITVVRRLTTDSATVVWSHTSSRDWAEWLQHSCPSPEDGSGLVLVLARKRDQKKGSVSQLLDGTADFGSKRANTGFKSSFNEKNRSYSWPLKEKITTTLVPVGRRSSIHTRHLHTGSREVRNLPFEKETFRKICKSLYIHPSIAKVISRADVPFFSRAQVRMGPPDPEGQTQIAYVYNCKSPNTWANDLALTVTYFPHSNMIYGIFFGCTAESERQILNRIASANEQAFHPMLLPGIFAELERTRMAEIVESTIDEIEQAIIDLDEGMYNASNEEPGLDTDEVAEEPGLKRGRRTVWLHTTFLRHRLQLWNTQLAKMVAHVDELLEPESKSNSQTALLGLNEFSKTEWESDSKLAIVQAGESEQIKQNETGQEFDVVMRQTSIMIKDRLRAHIEEFEDKMEDCTMRLDGMTIATQWSQNDINVGIAISTGQDSSQMRSIALVTMVFLPGTFVATLFSMTFFNWNDSGDGKVVVSSYIWIYFTVTAIFTIGTLLVWWYFLGRRRKVAKSAKSARQCC